MSPITRGEDFEGAFVVGRSSIAKFQLLSAARQISMRMNDVVRLYSIPLS
jgi:hypothetical protein